MPDIDTMPAGAELDILVVELVMEWPVVYMGDPDGDEWWTRVPSYPCLVVHSDGSNWIVRSDSDEDPLDGFEPSTDWAAAGEVLEQGHPCGWFDALYLCRYGDGYAVLTMKNDEPIAEGATGPLAISRAACKAVKGGA